MCCIDFHKQMLDNKKHYMKNDDNCKDSLFLLYTRPKPKSILETLLCCCHFSFQEMQIELKCQSHFAFVLIKIADCFVVVVVIVLRRGESVFPVVLRVFVVPFCWSPSITEISLISSASFTGQEDDSLR